MDNKEIRYFDSYGNVRHAKNPLVIPIDVMGEEGFGVLHSGVTITPKSNTKYIKPRFFSEEVADQLVENEIKRKQADEKVKQMLSGKEYAKLGGLTLGGAAAAGGAAYALPAISAYIAPTTIGGNIVGDMAGGLALGTAMEEGQRAAFGQSAGDILYKQVKPYLGDFAANMARPEYFVSPSMLFKGTYNAAQNTLGKQFERNISMPRAKEPLKSVQYSQTPTSQVSSDRISRIKKIASTIPDAYTQEALYMPNSELSTLSERYKFIPMYEGNIGEFNKKFDKEILDRLQEMGINLDSKIFVTPNNDTGRILTTPREFMKNSPNYVYYGLFEDSSPWKGLHFPQNGLVMVDPTFGKGFSTAMHEVNGHRRFPLIEALIDKGAMKPYSDIMDTLDDGIRNSTINSQSINELRATLLEVQRDIMYPIYKNNNKPSDLASIREEYRKAVDNLSDEDLKKMVSTINGYGAEYAKYATDKTWNAIKYALKYAPVATGIGVGLNNNN